MYLIIGANGFLGRYFIKNILTDTNDNILATDIILPENEENKRIKWQKCDVTSEEDLANINKLCAIEENLKVIYLAAYHHPDKVLQNPRLAWKINIIALAEFLNVFENIKTFYYPSTEVVYGQSHNGHKFTETDKLNPANYYGEQKIIAERMVNVAGYNVVRFPVLMGASLIPTKKHFYDQIIETVKSGGTMKMFQDQKRSMIDFDQASQIVIKLIENVEAHSYPIVNICGDEDLSKYELGLRIVRKYGLDESKIIPIKLDEDKEIFTAQRAKETLLDNSLLKKILNIKEIKIKI